MCWHRKHRCRSGWRNFGPGQSALFRLQPVVHRWPATGGVSESTTGAGRVLEPGIYGLSNHLLDTPWPKVLRAKSSWRSRSTSCRTTAACSICCATNGWPRTTNCRAPALEGLEWERLLSSAFIRGSGLRHAARSTIIRLDAEGCVDFTEWSWQADGSRAGQVNYQFRV